MPDRRQILRALLVGAAGAALPAGCGIPTGGAPKTYGTGPAYDPIGSGVIPAPVPERATTPKDLVELFLGAVSGLLDNESIKEAHNRANAFLTPEAAARWKPTDDVFVLRVTDLTSSTGANTIVSCTVQPVGRLMRDSGAVDPYPDSRPKTVQFTVTNTATGYRISELPALAPSNGLPLTVDALTSYYSPQLIYFWDASKSWLVPELRYVPRTVAVDAQLTQIVNWLLPGPGDPVTSTVTTSLIPSNTGVVGRVTLQGSQVTVPFSAALQGGDLQRILVQVQWSMQPLHRLSDGPVELQIGGQRQQVSNALEQYRQANLADASSGRADTPQAFYVIDKTVRAQTGALPAVLSSPDFNKDVTSAALSRDGQAAAIIRPNQLVIGRMEKGNLAVESVDWLHGRDWSRPVWLPSGRRLLIAVDGTLYAITADARISSQLIPSGVTAFAVSPDGFRIALIQNDVLQVAGLDQHTGDQPSVGTGNARTLDPGLTHLSAVAWSRMDRLVVAGTGTNNQWQLVEISIDGAVRDPWPVTFNPIVSVVAYAKLPTQVSSPGAVMVQTADKAAFRAYVNSPPDKLLPPDAPSASASPSGAAAQHPSPTAPFFPD